MATTLGAAVNRAHRVVGEPDVTVFDTDVILQNNLIDDANETVHKILEKTRYRWGLHRDYITTTAKINDGAVTITNGSTTVTSVSALEGTTAADNFTNVAAGMFLRRPTEATSYPIASTETTLTPDTVTLGDNYLGTTAATGVAYNIFQDTYPIATTSLDEVQMARYGDSPAMKDELSIVDIQTLMSLSGGDLHRNTTGKPTHMAQIAPDSSDQPQFVMWPYPNSAYLIELWYSIKFTSNTDFATNLFGGDAPDIFYDAVVHHMRWRACIHDEDFQNADRWMAAYQEAEDACVARDNSTHRDDMQASIQTYKRRVMRNGRGRLGVSQYTFDRS